MDKCAVKSLKGNCPNYPTKKVEINIDGENRKIYLCENCYNNVLNGAYKGVKICKYYSV